MKAIVYTKYGPPDVLQLKEIAKPVPKDSQVLVKVQAASANALDWRRFTLPRIFVRLMDGRVMKILNATLGVDLAGRVEAVGANVTQFQPGDAVFGDLSVCGLGAFAEDDADT